MYKYIYTDIYLYVELLVEALILAMLASSSSSYQNAPKGFEMLLFDVWVKAITYGEMLSVLTQPAP